MSKLFYVSNWPWHEHREMPRRVRWYKAMADEGDEYIALVEGRRGAEAFGVWHVLLGLALRSPFRGLLLTGGRVVEPYTIPMIAHKAHFRKAVVERGVAAILDRTNWLRFTEYNARPDTLSRRLWSEVFAVGGVKIALKARKRRGNSVLTLTLTNSHSQVKGKTPPLPPSKPKSPPSPPDPDGEKFQSWGNGSWGVIEKVADPLWIPYLRKRMADLRQYDDAGIVGHLLDIRNGKKKARNIKQLMGWIFWRLEHKTPSIRHYNRAKRLLRGKG